jgi:type IV secretion system protein VirD4
MNIWSTDGGIYCGHEVLEPYDNQTVCALNSPWKPTSGIFNYTGDGHLILIGPNGSGKTRNELVPNLFDLPNWSTLVVDPKGELAVWTAKHRKDAGSEIVIFDPFGVIERRYPGLVKELPYLKSRGFNAIAMLDPDSDDFADDAKLISEALIKVDERDAHWGESAQALVTGLVMALRMTTKDDGSPNSLAEVRQVLGMAPEALGAYISGLVRDTASEPAITAKLNRFTEINPANKELFSILSTAVTQTNWLDSKPIRSALSGGAFDFSAMKRRPVTVYLILPPRYLVTHSAWLRIMITAVLTPLIRSTTQDQDVPVLLMLDEFAALGRLEVIERTMPLMRGYGIKLWMILQDISQLKNSYKMLWESFIANAGIIQSFAPNDMTTREYLANLSGNRHYWVWTNSRTKSVTSNSNWGSESTSQSYQDSRTNFRDKIYPEDALAQMKREQSVLFEYQCPPRRILLPDPSKMSDFYPSQLSLPAPTRLSIGEILRQADEFAAQYDVSKEVAS